MIDCKGISKHFSEQVIFDDASFRVNTGERAGIVGPNGSGKSTLFGIITGNIEADGGEVRIPKGLRIGYLRQHLPDGAAERKLIEFTADAIPELAGISDKLHQLEHEMEGNPDKDKLTEMLREHGQLQSRFEQLGGYRLRTDAAAALSGLGFLPEDFSKTLNEFSGGWQMRAALARVLISRPGLLLLDEPSNYLDVPAVEWLYRFLQGFKGTLLLISHDRYLLRKLCDVMLEINSGRIDRYPGGYDYYRNEREHRRRTLEAAKANQDKKREQLRQNINRFKAKASKAAQAKSWQKQLDRMDDIVLPSDLQFTGHIRIPPAPPCGTEAARFEEVSFAYPGNDKKIFAGVDLQINSGDKIAFIGYNGAGKTTLLKLLSGSLKPDCGKVVLGHNIITGYQAQEFADILPDDCSVYNVVRDVVGSQEQLNSLPNLLGSFGFGGENMHKLCGVLSGGEKIRLCFARIFANPPNLLILDEPTTHLDIAAREALQEALKQYGGTVCLVSHDLEFIREAADTIVAMRPLGIRKYFGNYEYYLEKSAQEHLDIAEEDIVIADGLSGSGDVNNKERRRERARKRQEIAAVKKKAEAVLKNIENKIEALETEQAEAVALLSGGADSDIDFAQVNRRLGELQTELDNYGAKWEKAMEDFEEIMALNDAINA